MYNELTETLSKRRIVILRIESVAVIPPLHCEDTKKRRYASAKCERGSLCSLTFLCYEVLGPKKVTSPYYVSYTYSVT